MSVIPTFGMIPVVTTSYQFWYEYHTSVFAVNQRAQGETETTEQFITSLYSLAIDCELFDSANSRNS